MTSLQLARKAREMVVSNRPARLYRRIIRFVTGRILLLADLVSMIPIRAIFGKYYRFSVFSLAVI